MMKYVLAGALFAPAIALAQAIGAAPIAQAAPVTIDLTGIATTVIAGIFAILGAVIPYIINSRMKDTQAATTVSNAVKNSLGAIQQAATTVVSAARPSIAVPGGVASLAPGVQYVLDHAGEEAKRLNITPEAIADKINAQIGLARIAATTTAPAIVVQKAEIPVPTGL